MLLFSEIRNKFNTLLNTWGHSKKKKKEKNNHKNSKSLHARLKKKLEKKQIKWKLSVCYGLGRLIMPSTILRSFVAPHSSKFFIKNNDENPGKL